MSKISTVLLTKNEYRVEGNVLNMLETFLRISKDDMNIEIFFSIMELSRTDKRELFMKFLRNNIDEDIKIELVINEDIVDYPAMTRKELKTCTMICLFEVGKIWKKEYDVFEMKHKLLELIKLVEKE